MYPLTNASYLGVSNYNISLKCGNESNETIVTYGQSTITFNSLVMEKACVVKIYAFGGQDFAITGAAAFYSPGEIERILKLYLIVSRKNVL